MPRFSKRGGAAGALKKVRLNIDINPLPKAPTIPLIETTQF